MIELIEGLPDAVVGIEAIGQVEAADYKSIATPAVKHALERHPKIRLIHVLDDRFTSFTAGGAWQDAMLGLAHPRSFDRIAVVTDSESIRRMVTLAGWSIPGELKLFPNREREKAEAWATEGLGATPLGAYCPASRDSEQRTGTSDVERETRAASLVGEIDGADHGVRRRFA